uniref:Si:dkey-97o5.1 n=1 Tax=Echeneis naucrates TaxID=173247 RepID=A0A665VJF1_ECHNA
MFLPHIDLSELEDECFSKILPKVVTMFESMMKEILDQVGGLSSQNTELCTLLRNILQAMMQIVDALSTCVRHVGSFSEAPDLDAIRSLPTCILKVLRETFQHCKESEVVYCGRLSLVADLLQGLFKEAYSLQKGLLELLDRVSFDSSASEEDISDIVSVIHSLLDICSIISNLDIALHANTWKFLIKQSLKYQSLVEEHLHHGDICTSLCENLLASFQNGVELAEQIQIEATQNPEYKLFLKTAKMCRFFANTLVHYIKEFKFFLTKYCSCFHQLYLRVISKFPPSLCAPTLTRALCEELNAAALVPMDALLLQLLPLRAFAEVALQQDLLVPIFQFIRGLRLQPHLLKSLSILSVCRLPLYNALFTGFRRCYRERKVPVLLPGVMMKGQAQANVSLHHHLCVQLSASVAERCLVDAVLQADTQTALLATDVWCFTARYGSAELCLHHVLIIAQLVKSCTNECYKLFHMGLLLKRMVFLMTPNHQMELVDHYPPSDVENLPIWHHILLRALSQDARHRVETDIIVPRPHTHVDTQMKCKCITAFTVTLQVQTHPVLQCTLQLLLSLSALLVKNMEPQAISQALLCVEALVSQKCADQVLLAALEFLASLGKIFLPPDSQGQILPRLSSLFGATLADTSWVLHQHALEAFSHFAEVMIGSESVLCPVDADDFFPPSQPSPKRARQESSAEKEYSCYVQTAERALKALQALTEGGAGTKAPQPQWLQSRLQELQSLITNICTTRNTT